MKRRRALLFTITVVLALCAACGLWLHREQRQYALNRQLIVALEKNDFQTALALVNAGASPNTHLAPPPVPTLPQLLKQLLHHTPPPVNDSPTAIIMACGMLRDTGTHDGSRYIVLEENLPLLRAMLVHGANVNARLVYGGTALYNAIIRNRPHTVELLLSHGANPNEQDRWGISVLHDALVFSKDKSLLTELLLHGADPNLRDNSGFTPLHYAQQINRLDLVHLLKQHGAK